MKEYIVLNRTNGTTRNQSPYITLRISNGEDVLIVSVWDVPPHEGPSMGQIVQFANIKEYMGKRSCGRADLIEKELATETHPLYNLIPRPTSKKEWDECIESLMAYCNDSLLIDIIREFSEKLYTPYSRYPAATHVHHAYVGGLLNHTFQMLQMLKGLYPCLPYPIKPERCILAILFHDYGKLLEYDPQGEPQQDMFLLGHIYLGAHKLQNELTKRGLEEKEIKRIIHCVLAHHGQKEYGSPVLPCMQEAMIVNFLDNISAKSETMGAAGEMEYISALGTHVIKE